MLYNIYGGAIGRFLCVKQKKYIMKNKTLYLIFILCLVTFLALFLFGCNPNSIINEEISLRFPESMSSINVTLGTDINWNQYFFEVYDENDLLVETVAVDSSMISNSDLAKLNTPGQKSITIFYKGISIYWTVITHAPVEILSFRVNYYANEGNFESSTTIDESNERHENLSEIIELPIPVRSGYNFAGWFLTEDFSDRIIVTPYKVQKDINLFAKWEHSQRHTIEYREHTDEEDKGQVGYVANVIHASTRALMMPLNRPKYLFLRYEVYLLSTGNDPQFVLTTTQKGDLVVVDSDLLIKIIYETRMITITYFSEEWIEQSKSIQVEYGTSSDVPFFPFPEKLGFNGSWIDRLSSNPPSYSNIVLDMNIEAVYTSKTYLVRFYSENEVEIHEFVRADILHGANLQNPPAVPIKEGYTGIWTVISEGGIYVPIDILSFVVSSDSKIYARYAKNSYKLTYSFSLIEDSTANLTPLTSIKTYEYASTINFIDTENLYENKIFDEKLFRGYDSKYYEIKWYTSQSFESAKLVYFPYSVKANDAVFYARVTDRPYIVDFIIPVEFGDFTSTRIHASKNSMITPPEYEIDGYDIVGWYHYINYVDYSDDIIYVKNDWVKYESNYYKCLVDESQHIQPTNVQNWVSNADIRPQTILYTISDPQILVDDIYIYDEDTRFDKAFYPQVMRKTYSLRFFTWEITGSPGSYVVDKSVVARNDILSINHGTNIRLGSYFESSPGTEYPPYPPSYPAGGQESNFQLLYWYTDIDYVSSPIDPNGDYLVTSNVNFYAYWTDLLAGTEGLVLALSEDNLSYEVIQFKPRNKDYSSIDVIIPENYQGLPVVSIKDNAFAENLNGIQILSIFIPSKIVSIGENAFSGCKDLITIQLDVANAAFDISDGVLFSKNKTTLICMPANLLIEDQLVTTYNVPKEVITILGGAFSNCRNLISIDFEESTDIQTIGELAFSGCCNLVSIVLPNSLLSISNRAFLACYNLTIIDISEESLLFSVGSEILNDTIWFINKKENIFVCLGKVLLGYNPTSEDHYISVPDFILSLADHAFDFDEFEGNYLESITFGTESNLSFIGRSAFAGCNLLCELYILTGTKVSFVEESFRMMSTTCTLTIPSTLVDDYNADPFVADAFSVDLGNLIGQ